MKTAARNARRTPKERALSRRRAACRTRLCPRMIRALRRSFRAPLRPRPCFQETSKAKEACSRAPPRPARTRGSRQAEQSRRRPRRRQTASRRRRSSPARTASSPPPRPPRENPAQERARKNTARSPRGRRSVWCISARGRSTQAAASPARFSASARLRSTRRQTAGRAFRPPPPS